MDSFRNYLLSITAAAILCSLVKNLLPGKSTASSLIRILCGIFMAYALINPIFHLQWDPLNLPSASFTSDARQAVSEGEKAAAEVLAAVIKSKTESYILDKATAMEADLDVDVTLQELIPARVELRGPVSPYVRSSLCAWISQQLGIPEEAQIWIGQQ